MSRNKLYWIVSLACLAGYSWLFINELYPSLHDKNASTCLIKHVTGIPCPSCGSTRAVLSFFNGNISDSLHWNPLGLVLVMLMLACPLLITYDLLKRKETLLWFYHQTESVFKQKWIAIPSALLVLSNWIWNICKGL